VLRWPVSVEVAGYLSEEVAGINRNSHLGQQSPVQSNKVLYAISAALTHACETGYQIGVAIKRDMSDGTSRT